MTDFVTSSLTTATAKNTATSGASKSDPTALALRVDAGTDEKTQTDGGSSSGVVFRAASVGQFASTESFLAVAGQSAANATTSSSEAFDKKSASYTSQKLGSLLDQSA